MPTLEFYNNEIAVKKKILNQVTSLVGMSTEEALTQLEADTIAEEEAAAITE